MIKNIVLLFISFSFISCVTVGMLSEEEKKVKISFSKIFVNKCRFINGFTSHQVSTTNTPWLKRRAFQMGGDTMVIQKMTKNTLSVEVYRCSE